MKLFIIIAVSLAFSYLLYIRGYTVIQAKIAVAYIGRRSKNSWGAAVTACTGFTKRVLPLESGRIYNFEMEYNASDGEIAVEISKGKELLLTLDKNHTAGSITAERAVYILKTKFTKASGDYEVKWS